METENRLNLFANENKKEYKLGSMVNITKCAKKPPVKYPLHPKFGSIFAPHILKMDYKLGHTGGYEAHIQPYDKELFAPGSSVLHYGQSVFEGLKAYRQKDGSVAAFRADLHGTRLMKSARRLAIPEFSEEVFMTCLLEYLKFESESVPSEPEHSLYLRPLLIARDEIIKIGRSQTYTFFVMSAVAGSYFHGRASKVARVLVNRQFIRAFPGGLGEVKTAGNYASSLMAQTYAEKYECDQVLYLDALRHDNIDELGGMNFFAVRGREILTPSLQGTILNGVTRRSLIEIAPKLGLKATEAPLSLSQVISEIQSGTITEVFACGTAAVVHSIGELVVQDKTDGPVERIKLPEQTPVAQELYQTLGSIQRGALPAPGPWLFRA